MPAAKLRRDCDLCPSPHVDDGLSDHGTARDTAVQPGKNIPCAQTDTFTAFADVVAVSSSTSFAVSSDSNAGQQKRYSAHGQMMLSVSMFSGTSSCVSPGKPYRHRTFIPTVGRTWSAGHGEQGEQYNRNKR